MLRKAVRMSVVNPAADVLRFGPALSQLRLGLRDIAFDSATGEDGNIGAGLKSKISVRLSRRLNRYRHTPHLLRSPESVPLLRPKAPGRQPSRNSAQPANRFVIGMPI